MTSQRELESGILFPQFSIGGRQTWSIYRLPTYFVFLDARLAFDSIMPSLGHDGSVDPLVLEAHGCNPRTTASVRCVIGSSSRGCGLDYVLGCRRSLCIVLSL